MRHYKLLLSISMLLISHALHANTPQDTVNTLFNAMREHDSQKLQSLFLPSALLQRATQEGEIKQSDLAKFAEFVGTSQQSLDEQLLSINVQQSDNLAAVWTPYVFYLDEQISHCGVNSFQLVRVEGNWQIQYLIDNMHPGDCAEFILKH